MSKSKKVNNEDPSTPTLWIWIFAVSILLFFVGSIVVIVLAVQEADEPLPEVIDAVIFEDEDLGDVGDVFSTKQAVLIHRHMKFLRNIYILTTQEGFEGSAKNATGLENSYYVKVDVKNVSNVDEYFVAMKDVKEKPDKKFPSIASHAVFLSNRTVPLRGVSKNHMFYEDRPRMFNVFREASEIDLLGSFFEKTAPTFVMKVDSLERPFALGESSADTVRNIVLMTITEERGTTRNDVNRDILLYGKSSSRDNFIKQASELFESTPVFATFHITGVDEEGKQISKKFAKEYLACNIAGTLDRCVYSISGVD